MDTAKYIFHIRFAFQSGGHRCVGTHACNGRDCRGDHPSYGRTGRNTPIVRKRMARTGAWMGGWNVVAGLLTWRDPCSSELRRAGVPGGTVLAFVLTAPLLNPISFLYGLTLGEPKVILSFTLITLAKTTIVAYLWEAWFGGAADAAVAVERERVADIQPMPAAGVNGFFGSGYSRKGTHGAQHFLLFDWADRQRCIVLVHPLCIATEDNGTS